MTKVLDLPLKKEWYEMIESGTKKEEYRVLKPFWLKRIFGCDMNMYYCSTKAATCYCCNVPQYIKPKDFTHVRFRYGYTNRTMAYKIDRISIGVGNPEWGAPKENVIIISIGDKVTQL